MTQSDLDQLIDQIQTSLTPSQMGIDPQKRLQPFLKKLGIDLSKLPPIIHAVGTNGKGSTLAYMKAYLNKKGFKCHRYTSPHLIHYTERIEVADDPISSEVFKSILDQLKDYESLSLFDILTLVALKVFTENDADYCLLEAGLGGRYDSTNLDYPTYVIRAITSISLDHQEYLGESLEQIRAEKLAVIRPQDQVFYHQKMTSACEENLTLAQQILENGLGFKLTSQELNELLKTLWRGRYHDITQSFSKHFGCENLGHKFYIDGAHNVSAIQALISYFGYKNVIYVVQKNTRKPQWKEVVQEISPDHLMIVDGLDRFILTLEKEQKKTYRCLLQNAYLE